MTEASRNLAIFDFDGTLIRGDSFIPYLFCVYLSSLLLAPRRFVSISLRLPKIIKNSASHLRGTIDARSLKEMLLSAFIEGLTVTYVNRISRLFCKLITRLARKEIVQSLRELKRQGYITVLVSASPDLYLKEIRDIFGFDFLMSTKAEIVDDRVTGKIIGENCKGVEKLRRLREVFTESEIKNAISYADDESDTPLMEIVRKPIWI